MRKILKILISLIPVKKWRKRLRNKYIKKKARNIFLNGQNNSLIIESGGKEYDYSHEVFLSSLKDGYLIINGSNNVIRLRNFEKTASNSSLVCNGNNTFIDIDSPVLIHAVFNYYLDLPMGGGKRCVKIKKNATINGLTIHMDEGRYLEIGENCLMSYDVCFWLTDGHTIISEDGSVNDHYNNKFIIGDHVWIGYNVTLTPKSQGLPSDCVVGACSLVCKSFEENGILLAGNPARIIKHNISWDHLNSHLYLQKSGENHD